MRRNIITTIIATIISATVLLLCFTGCGTQAAEPINITFILGIVDGESLFDDGISEFSSMSSSPGTNYAFISIEGEPTAIGESGTIPDFSDYGYTKVMLERIYSSITADLTSRLGSYEPSSAEIDMASAIELGVRTLKANATEGRQNILVLYCSGKSTTGLINMLDTPVYKLDAEASATSVAKNMSIDMSGIDVIWYCCGDFSGEDQQSLSAEERVNLQSFYESLFTKLGADSVTFKDDLPSAECYSFEETPVSVVEVEGIDSQLVQVVELEPEIFEDADETLLDTPILISEDKICFKPDSDEFLDQATAEEALQPIADFMLEYTDVSILVYGTCAGDTDSDYTLQLGKARAESVKQALVTAGVDESRITTVAVKATDDPYYEFGLGTGDEASVNRKCIIADMTSDLAQQILSCSH